MQDLYIEKTKSTPEIQFNAQNHKLRIEGQSYPENAFKFYEPVFHWVDRYLQQFEQEVVLEIYFYMPYINTSSSKCIMMLLEKLEDAHQDGQKATVRWYYDEENEMALECAEEFKEDLTIPFEICPVAEEK
ncbi:DUF1987 domain-containing protein [Sporomusa acidovorans]|uniref:SiaC family regulatory phosphoprotein domain-containing protein n=1 Tax=Sporomusa acidovorans (strain ATCC 49682 / DSM 3132 / Mol) TaxID=1123286 RepID=A0ABZ3IWL4_SPOA4|nr:DUF1987 domain-containing protein [Sporomusa acidovorans]OZC24047.1 hypothetical protein SPACI_03110 [Sporomusa acidovorans DSM 3132]SDF57999.1 protein of unknown function [Sporomusa acidovorans]